MTRRKTSPVKRMIDILADAWLAVDLLREQGCDACGAQGEDSWWVSGAPGGGFDASCTTCGARRDLPTLPEQLELIT